MKQAVALLLVAACLALRVSARDLARAPAQAPASADDALLALVNPKGVVTAAVPLIGGSDVKTAPGAVTVVKPGGQTQAVLSLATGNSTLQILPSATSSGFVTISSTDSPDLKVSLAPRQRASAPSADATSPASNTVDLLNAMTRFYTFTFDGDFRSVDVDVSSSNTATSVSVVGRGFDVSSDATYSGDWGSGDWGR